MTVQTYNTLRTIAHQAADANSRHLHDLTASHLTVLLRFIDELPKLTPLDDDAVLDNGMKTVLMVREG